MPETASSILTKVSSVLPNTRWRPVLCCLALSPLVLQVASRTPFLSPVWSLTGRILSGLVVLVVRTLLQTYQTWSRWAPKMVTTSPQGIDASKFPGEEEFDRILSRIGSSGPRTTGNSAHNELIRWLEGELRKIPGLEIYSDEYEILRWQTVDGTLLQDAGKLTISTSDRACSVPIAGVVPFSLPTTGHTGQLLYLPQGTPISKADVKGKIILRDFPERKINYSTIFLPSYSKTADLNKDFLGIYDRPGHADGLLNDDLIAAGQAGASGMIIMFDIERVQLESYFEPHKGVHYEIPAMFVGVDEAVMLKCKAAEGATATLSIEAEIATVPTRNVTAVLPGQTTERIIYESHTDGNTYVQENGPVALMTLAQYFASRPIDERRRTIEFTFATAHLHISREGSARHAQQLNASYDSHSVALVIPVEHLGTREIEAVPRGEGLPGRRLVYSGRGELMLWCVGPSPIVVSAVEEAVARRKLDRVSITRGASLPNPRCVPTFASFGGVGTYYHNWLLPTASLISAPWSLWAPSFGKQAVDVTRLRAQTLAIGDLYAALQDVKREIIEGGYGDYRRRRADGTPTVDLSLPVEQASLLTSGQKAGKL